MVWTEVAKKVGVDNALLVGNDLNAEDRGSQVWMDGMRWCKCCVISVFAIECLLIASS
jgi:hypothetical protein